MRETRGGEQGGGDVPYDGAALPGRRRRGSFIASDDGRRQAPPPPPPPLFDRETKRWGVRMNGQRYWGTAPQICTVGLLPPLQGHFCAKENKCRGSMQKHHARHSSKRHVSLTVGLCLRGMPCHRWIRGQSTRVTVYEPKRKLTDRKSVFLKL